MLGAPDFQNEYGDILVFSRMAGRYNSQGRHQTVLPVVSSLIQSPMSEDSSVVKERHRKSTSAVTNLLPKLVTSGI